VITIPWGFRLLDKGEEQRLPEDLALVEFTRAQGVRQILHGGPLLVRLVGDEIEE
jgi:hypothetical protein